MAEVRLNRLPVRFLVKTMVDDDTGCWIWRGAISGNGYGYFWWEGRMVRAHSFAYERTIKPIPAHREPWLGGRR